MFRQDSQDAALHAVVVRDHMQAALRARRLGRRLPDQAIIPLVDFFGRDRLGQVHALQAGKFLGGAHGGVLIDVLARHDAAGLRPLVAQQPGELAGVDIGDRHHLAAKQEALQRLGGTPVRMQQRQVANHEPRGISRAGLEIFRRRAGVADMRIGQGNDLSAVRGIGEDLLVPGHRRIENYFTCRVAFCAY